GDADQQSVESSPAPPPRRSARPRPRNAMRKLLALALLLGLCGPARAWNETGHLVTARLAWRQLTAGQRARVVAVLKQHPHYEEYLAAHRPEGFSEDEWAFMRAA